jgi:riboflavin synthase
MFTGLIADLGRVVELDTGAGGARLRIATALAGEVKEGDSVAVDGVCLTATAVDGEGFRTEAMPETLQRSSLASLAAGDAVNLELALRAADRLGGHLVQGHVDGTGTVIAVQPEGISRVVEIEAEPELTRYLVEKGSVAVNGVSLTVSALGEGSFSVSLIPETLTRTTLGAIAPGAKVNIEVDVLAKHVERLMGARI